MVKLDCLLLPEFSGFDLICTLFRPVAQLAEHVTLNHGVEGSIPSGPTKI